MPAGPFTQPHALEFTALFGFLRGHCEKRKDRDCNDDDEGY